MLRWPEVNTSFITYTPYLDTFHAVIQTMQLDARKYYNKKKSLFCSYKKQENDLRLNVLTSMKMFGDSLAKVIIDITYLAFHTRS